MSLSIRDILILDFFNGKPLHTKVPSYQQDIYGAGANERIQALCDEGWIRHSRPQETVNMLPDKALSDFLAAHGKDASGTHSELVRRVIREIPEEKYALAVPKVYVATTDGKLEMAHHMAYILNARGNYGFSEGEIGEAQRSLNERKVSFTASDILKYAFQQKSALFVMAGEWTKLRNLYFTIANFYLRSRSNEEALSYLFLVFLLDMSGMENRNALVQYDKLFPTQKGIIVLINQIRTELSLTDRGVKSAFLTAIARMAPRLPFSYFSPQIMATLLVERLEGKEFSHEAYRQYINVPNPAEGGYHYDFGGAAPAEKTDSRPAESLLIHRKVVPAVPPVLRMPAFTAPPPFVPPGARRREEKPPAADVPQEKEEAPSGWLSKLHRLWKDKGNEE